MRIFIGHDKRMPGVADTMAYSIRKNSSIPVEIHLLDLAKLKKDRGFDPQPDPQATTEFTRSRFLVPWLCNYEGWALFTDNDMICLGDVAELATLAAQSECYALLCVKHNHMPTATVKMDNQVQTSYPRKNWSSVMLLNCSRLKLWTKAIVENVHPRYLHRFMDIEDTLIGDLPAEWNELDKMSRRCKILHYTSGGPYLPGCENCAHAELWNKYDSERRSAEVVNYAI